MADHWFPPQPPLPVDSSLRAFLVWLLKLDAHLDDWAIPDPRET